MESSNLKMNLETNNSSLLDSINKTPQKYAGPKFHTSSPSANSLPIPISLLNPLSSKQNTASEIDNKKSRASSMSLSMSLPQTISFQQEENSKNNKNKSIVSNTSSTPSKESKPKLVKQPRNEIYHGWMDYSYYTNKNVKKGSRENFSSSYYQKKQYAYTSLSDPESLSKQNYNPPSYKLKERRKMKPQENLMNQPISICNSATSSPIVGSGNNNTPKKKKNISSIKVSTPIPFGQIMGRI